MKKRLFGILFAILLCLSLSVPAFAQGNMPLLVDNADLLTDSEESELLSKLKKISNDQQMDIVIVTTSDLYGETPRDYADDFYDYNGYAEDGILLLVSMEDSDWYISTSGYGITAITDAGREYMAEQFVDDLGDADYYDALIIRLGSGQGDNWWCVAYPPLCFVGEATDSSGVRYKSKLIELINKFWS